MNAVTICGKEYQLCMTVEAFDQITQACGGMDKLGATWTAMAISGKWYPVRHPSWLSCCGKARKIAGCWPAFAQTGMRQHAKCRPRQSCENC